VAAGCLDLARLAIDRQLAIRTIEVRIDQDGEWLPLRSKAYSAPVSGYDESLLPWKELTVERFASWITLNDRLNGLASAVHELGEGTMQARVLVGTSLVEGLQRRLLFQRCQFPRRRAAGAPGSRRPPAMLRANGRRLRRGWTPSSSARQ